MGAATDDRIIQQAQERLLVAAEAIRRGRAELRAVLRSLERHPDYLVSERRSRKGQYVTLAWWLHNGTCSTLFDMSLDDAPELLVADADPDRLEEGMRLNIAQMAREEKLREAKRRTA